MDDRSDRACGEKVTREVRSVHLPRRMQSKLRRGQIGLAALGVFERRAGLIWEKILMDLLVANSVSIQVGSLVGVAMDVCPSMKPHVELAIRKLLFMKAPKDCSSSVAKICQSVDTSGLYPYRCLGVLLASSHVGHGGKYRLGCC